MSEHGFMWPDGTYVQAIDGDPEELLAGYPDGTVEVPVKPGGKYRWKDGQWAEVEPTPVVPDRVTARQFGLQMIAAGIQVQVENWVAAQDTATQWAFERSATFVRDDPMMGAGFTALGYTTEQIDAFFVAAAKL